MKKVVLMALAVFCLLLAGCEGQGNPVNGSRYGNGYEHYQLQEVLDGGVKVSAEGYLEDVLPVVYFNTAEETQLTLDCNILSGDANIQLFYVYENEQGVQEQLIFEDQAASGGFSANLVDVTLDLAAGESRLEWRTANKDSALVFELILPDMAGVDYAMNSAADQAEWDAMLGALDEQLSLMEQLDEQLGSIEQLKEDFYEIAKNNPSLNGETLGVRNRERELKAGESFVIAYPAAKEACTLGLFVWLAEHEGDLQLVYVQPDGADKLLWSSEGQEEWLIDLVIDLLPGEGRLEFRTENGVKCQFNIVIERSEKAGVTGFSI